MCSWSHHITRHSRQLSAVVSRRRRLTTRRVDRRWTADGLLDTVVLAGEGPMGTVDEVRERLPIEHVVGKIVTLKRAGSTYKGLCPFHTEKTPSFIVTPSRGRYHCFGCLPPGSLIKTQHGMRPIETIQVGDLVYAGDGRLHPVAFTHEHAFSGELVSLACAPFKVPILLTANH